MLLHMLTLTMTPQVVVPDAKPVTCVHYDTLSDLLWLGHADGQVTAFAVSPGQTAALNPQHVLRWQAQRTGAVTAIARTAQGDLWTGSSRGSLRIWAPECASAGGAVPAAPGTARELRRPPGARQPHSSAVALLLAPATGQVQVVAMLSAVLINLAVDLLLMLAWLAVAWRVDLMPLCKAAAAACGLKGSESAFGTELRCPALPSPSTLLND